MDLFGFISTLASLLVKGLESIYAFLIYLMNFPTRISVVLSSMPNYISYTISTITFFILISFIFKIYKDLH